VLTRGFADLAEVKSVSRYVKPLRLLASLFRHWQRIEYRKAVAQGIAVLQDRTLD